MKTRILTLLLVLVLLSLSLFSCGGEGDGEGEGDNTPPVGDGGNTDGGDGDEGDETEKDYSRYVFGGEFMPKYVIGTDVDDTLIVNQLYAALRTSAGQLEEYYYAGKEELDDDTAHEVILGKSERKASERAYRKLRTLQRTNDYYYGYVVYATGASVAIAFDEELDDLALKTAVNHFISEYLTGKSELKLTSGVVLEETFSILEYYEEVDRQYYEEAWKNLADKIGGKTGLDIVAAFQQMYGIYNHDVVTWIANLYDPGVGGFYYSNSARDNGSYAPDTESTSQALGFVSNLGKVRAWRTGESGNYANTLSETRKNEIVVYIKSLQAPNGFFYNYQWDPANTDAHMSRRARDLNWCTSMLSALGARPTYNTPNGINGDGKVVVGTYTPGYLMSIPGQLGGSTVAAVSKVVLAASYAPEFENIDTLKAYLKKLDNSGSSFYSIGNTMTSQMAQITARDKDLRTEFYNDPANKDKQYQSLASVVVDFFNEHQDPTTGLWGQDAKAPANYLGVNGLLKISGVYTSAGAEIPYAEKAAKAAIDAITSDEVMGAVVDLYNTWFSVSNILNNLKKYGKTIEVDGVTMTGTERADKIMKDLREIAAPAIIKSGVKISDFAKADGSYSYTKHSSSSTSQGMPVAVPGTNEGDVNATVIATNGLVGNICSALGISQVAIYGERDFRIFLGIFENLQPVLKHNPIKALDDVPLTFDDNDPGDDYCDLGGGMPEGGFLVEKDTRENAKGNTVKVYSNATSAGGTVTSKNNAANKTQNCYVFEADMRINEGTAAGYFMQVTMGSSYMFSLKRSGNSVTVFESTTASSASARYIDIATIPVGTWFNLRVEYYKDGYNGIQRACYYINGELKAVTDGFYGMKKGTPSDGDYVNGVYSGKPSTASLTETKLYKMMSCKLDMNLDNVYTTSINKQYTVPTSQEGLVYNVDKDAKPIEKPEA